MVEKTQLNNPLKDLEVFGIIPVIKIDRPMNALPLAKSLIAGGLPCAEITFRTEAAEESIRRIAGEMSEMIVGAGTVLNCDQAQRAVLAGARFIVSPGLDLKVVHWCLDHYVPVIPGVATPSEIIQGMNEGLNILKFFPAELLGGIELLKTYGSVFDKIKFIPTGGLNIENLGQYLSCANVHTCGGTWIATNKMISSGNFKEITLNALQARSQVRKIRGEEKI